MITKEIKNRILSQLPRDYSLFIQENLITPQEAIAWTDELVDRSVKNETLLQLTRSLDWMFEKRLLSIEEMVDFLQELEEESMRSCGVKKILESLSEKLDLESEREEAQKAISLLLPLLPPSSSSTEN